MLTTFCLNRKPAHRVASIPADVLHGPQFNLGRCGSYERMREADWQLPIVIFFASLFSFASLSDQGVHDVAATDDSQ